MRKLLLLIFVLLLSLPSYAANTDDFSTLGANSGYTDRNTTAGWKGTNCAIVKVGDYTSMTMNGKTTTVGTITSPTLSNGISKLTFHYANTFNEKNGVKIKIDIIQNEAVAVSKELSVANSSVTKGTDYSVDYSDLNVSGDFMIKFTNLCPTNSTSNADRVSIFGISWENYSADPDAIVMPMITVDDENNVTITCATEDAEVYYTTNGEDPTTEDNLYTAPFAITENCTIKAKAFKGDRESAVASVEVELPYTNLADVNKLTEGSVKIKADMTIFYKNGNYVFLTDGVTNTLAFGKYDSVEEGENISNLSGIVSVAYNQLFEITSANFTKGGNGAKVIESELTSLADVNYGDNLFDVVTLSGVTIPSGSNKSFTLAMGEETIALYNQFGLTIETSATQKYDVKAIVGRYNETLQLWPMEITEYDDPADTREEVELTWSETEVIAVIGEQFNQPELTASNPSALTEVKYTSSNPEVAWFDEYKKLNLVGSKGFTIITAEIKDSKSFKDATASYKLKVQSAPQVSFEDVLNYGKNGTFHSDSSDDGYLDMEFISEEGIEYLGNMYHASTQDAIQLRVSTLTGQKPQVPSGVVVVSNPNQKFVSKIIINWNSKTTASTSSPRELEVYGKDETLTLADLYSADNRGELIESVKYDSENTDIVINPKKEWNFIGFKAKGGACFLNSISIYWDTHTPAQPTVHAWYPTHEVGNVYHYEATEGVIVVEPKSVEQPMMAAALDEDEAEADVDPSMEGWTISDDQKTAKFTTPATVTPQMKAGYSIYSMANGKQSVAHELSFASEGGAVSGVEGVAVGAVEAPVQFFNLNGQVVKGELVPGVYIRRQGAKASKVIIR